MAQHLYTLEKGGIYSWVGLDLLALIYLCFFIYLFASLLFNVANTTITLAHPPAQQMNFIYIGIILLSLLNIYDVITNFSTGIVLLATDIDYGKEIYTESTINGVYTKHDSGGNIQIFGVLGNIAKSIAPLFLCFYLTTRKINKFILAGLILSTFITYMHAISMGLRSVIFLNILVFFASYMFLKRFYTETVNKIFKKVVLVFMSVILFGFGAITFSRYGNDSDSDMIKSIESYASQCFLYFGKYGFDNGEQIRNGDRTMPFIKSLVSDNVARSTFDRRNKYTKMNINESVFVTFVGDFVFDYGVFWGTFVLLILYWIFGFFLKTRGDTVLHFDQLLISFLVMYILCGFYLYPLADYAGNILFVALLLMALFFKCNRKYETI